ncbi:MAG: hypothetical protein ACJ8CR_09210 [Roseiflexaceae bacterium]
MGKKSRAKRERREQTGFVAALTACEGTWLEKPPTPEEQKRIDAAAQVLKQHRGLANEFASDGEAANRFSIELFRMPVFAPLQFEDWLIESVIDKHGEPPVVEDDSDPAFSDWLRAAVLDVASSRVRRAMAEQVRRFLPMFVENEQFKEALAIDYNAYLTVMSDAVTPLLAQMMVGGLSRWYDEHEEDEEEAEAVDSAK